MPPTTTSGSTAIQSSARTKPKKPDDVLAETEQQWLYTEEELLQTPSIVDGMSAKEERELRSKGVNFITQVGIMLKLPQTTMTAASTYFNRFLMRKSLVSKKDGGQKALHHYQVAAVCIFLATKVEEQCRKMKEIVVAVCRVAQKNPNLIVDEQTKDYWRWRDTILYNEDVLLETLCFDLTIESPYEKMFALLQDLKQEHNKKLRTSAWAFINDSNMTQLCVMFSATTIAGTAVYLGCRQHEIRLPDHKGKPWWEYFNVSMRDVTVAANYICNIYEQGGLPKKEGQAQLYVRLPTPVDGSPELTKTRLIVEQTPDTVHMERSTSDQSSKRPRQEEEEEEDGTVNGTAAGTSTDQQDSKRTKTTNGLPNFNGRSAPPQSEDTSKDDDDVSEEGEVEE